MYEISVNPECASTTVDVVDDDLIQPGVFDEGVGIGRTESRGNEAVFCKRSLRQKSAKASRDGLREMVRSVLCVLQYDFLELTRQRRLPLPPHRVLRFQLRLWESRNSGEFADSGSTRRRPR